MPPAAGPVLQPSSSTDPVAVGINISVTNWQPSKPLTCLSKLHCDLDRPEPRLGGAFEVAASRSRHLATLNGCKTVAYTVILKDEWTRSEAFAPPPGSGSCAFAFVHEDSKFVTLHPEGGTHPQQDRDETKEDAAPSSITPYEGEAWCVNGILGHSQHGCCAASCGRCGGDECDRLPGGGFECCPAIFDVVCSTPEEVACLLPKNETLLPSPSPSALPPQTGRDETKEDTVAQAGTPEKVDAQKAAGQATEIAHTAAPSSITPYEGEVWCVNGILGHSQHGCCAASCGRCGGDECDRLPGGGFECCPAIFDVVCSTPEEVACLLPKDEAKEETLAHAGVPPPSPPMLTSLYKTHTGMNSWYKDRPAQSTDCEWLCREDPRCADHRFDVVHASCALFDQQALSLSLLAEPTRQTKPRPHAIRLLQQEQKQADDWILIEVPRDDLPWPVDNYRRNSRVPKLLPHLFFPPTVDATVYIDAENSVTADLHVVVQSMLFSCNASFAAQTSPSRAVSVMKEFEVVRYSKNAVEPEACQKQERAYRADKAYMATVNEGRAVGINAELLVRRNLYPYNLLGNAWMRAYLRGGDRDQPAFSYAFEQSVMKPCRKRFEETTGADKTGYSKGQCGLACGTGFVNLVGSARSADCLGDSVKTYCENQPEGFCEVKPRPWWATEPPGWVCSSKL